MKVYNLQCERHHGFEGWFASNEDFVAQAESGQLCCPVCDSAAIRKLPSAPRLNLGQSATPRTDGDGGDGAALQTRVLELARQLIAGTEDVGERFAEEARRMHYDEAPPRGIRGIASDQERRELAEEGIEVLALPLAPFLKQPLQ